MNESLILANSRIGKLIFQRPDRDFVHAPNILATCLAMQCAPPIVSPRFSAISFAYPFWVSLYDGIVRKKKQRRSKGERGLAERGKLARDLLVILHAIRASLCLRFYPTLYTRSPVSSSPCFALVWRLLSYYSDYI